MPGAPGPPRRRRPPRVLWSLPLPPLLLLRLPRATAERDDWEATDELDSYLASKGKGAPKADPAAAAAAADAADGDGGGGKRRRHHHSDRDKDRGIQGRSSGSGGGKHHHSKHKGGAAAADFAVAGEKGERRRGHAARPPGTRPNSKRLRGRGASAGAAGDGAFNECEDGSFPRVVLVVAPPLYAEPSRDVTGMYQIEARHRGAPMYRSKGCRASGNCILYTDGGSWLVSHLEDAHVREVGIMRSVEPLDDCRRLAQALHGQGSDPPRKWEVLTSAGIWDSEERLGLRVGTRELLMGEGIDWEAVIRDQSRAADGAPGQERRMDKDGRTYTRGEFIAYYGERWQREWDEAKDRTPAPPTTPEPPESHQYTRGEAVVATKNIMLGGILACRKGSPGVVMGPAGRRHPDGLHRNYMVRFMGEFAQAIIINTHVEQMISSKAKIGLGDIGS